MPPSISKFLPLFFATAAIAAGQQPATESTDGELDIADNTTATSETKIISPLPDGSPQPPAEPPARLQTTSSDILYSQKRKLAQRDITFQRLKPISLPALPEQTAAQDAEMPPSVESPAERKSFKVVMLGASVNIPDGNPEHARTLVQIWNGQSGQYSSLWVNANFLWLTGFAEFESAGTIYSLLLAVSRGSDEVPSLSFPSETEASIIIEKGQPSAEDLAPINALLKLYNDPAEREKLKTAFEGRLRESQRLEAERAANPPEKRPLVLQYWRLDDAGLEGRSPKPATIR